MPEHAARERKDRADVELPERSREAARDAELERSDDTAGADDSRELREGRGRVVDVAKEVREGQMVEGAIVEGKRLGRGLDELDAVAEAACAIASISGLWSRPVTRNPRRTSSAATSPVPVATSST